MADIFISHANEDATVAKDVCAALEASGVTCWIAPRDIVAGADYRSEILRGVAESAALLLLYSPAASRSEHVAREVSLADEGDKPIFPLRIDTHELEGPLRYVLQGKQWVDFRADPAAAVSSVVQAMKGSAPARSPKIRRRGLSPLVLGLSALAMLAVGVGGYFGYRAWDAGQAFAACDRAAGSELEIGAPDGAGVPFGMIDPGTAVAACERAVKIRPKEQRLRFNLFRALAAATPTQRNKNFLIGLPKRMESALTAAAQSGHLEAVLVLASLARQGNGGIDPPATDVVVGARDRLVSMALGGDARAQYLLSQALQTQYNLLPMCAFLAEGETPEPFTESERSVFDWIKAEFIRGNPSLATNVAQSTDVAGFNLAANASLCDLGRNYLLAHASVQNLAAAQLELSHVPLAEDAAVAVAGWIEARPTAALLAAATAQDYAPALYDDARGAIICRSEEGTPLRATSAAWTRLEHLAETGYRPAMAELATLILIGCAPSEQGYAEARAWLERATAGMEIDQ